MKRTPGLIVTKIYFRYFDTKTVNSKRIIGKGQIIDMQGYLLRHVGIILLLNRLLGIHDMRRGQRGDCRICKHSCHSNQLDASIQREH